MADEINFSPFSFTIEGHLSLTKGATVVTLNHVIKTHKGPIGINISGKSEIPASLFVDEQQQEAWAATIDRAFQEILVEATLDEAMSTLSDIIHFYLNYFRIESIDMKEVLREHTRAAEARLKERLDLRGPGRRSEWTRLDLTNAVSEALKELPKKREQTYNHIARVLKEKYPDKAPESGDSLRKTLKRFEINLKELKIGRKYRGFLSG
jgi:hypothetical protein